MLGILQGLIKPGQMLFVGGTDPINPKIERPETVRDRVPEAAKSIPADALGITDDCGFSTFAEDTSTTRDGVCQDYQPDCRDDAGGEGAGDLARRVFRKNENLPAFGITESPNIGETPGNPGVLTRRGIASLARKGAISTLHIS